MTVHLNTLNIYQISYHIISYMHKTRRSLLQLPLSCMVSVTKSDTSVRPSMASSHLAARKGSSGYLKEADHQEVSGTLGQAVIIMGIQPVPSGSIGNDEHSYFMLFQITRGYVLHSDLVKHIFAMDPRCSIVLEDLPTKTGP